MPTTTSIERLRRISPSMHARAQMWYTRGMETFSAVGAVRTGWHTFLRRPLFFVGVSFGFFLLYTLLSWVGETDQRGGMSLLMGIASFIVGVVIEMFLINLMLAANDHPDSVSLAEGSARMPFLQYAAVKIVSGIVIIVGLILLIVPGVIAILALMFSNYLVVDKGLSFTAAMRESYRITRPHWLQLFILLIALIVINVAGALLLFVGLLVTVPVSLLTMAHAYRTLEHSASELVPVSAS